jgi:hypothetical protein
MNPEAHGAAALLSPERKMTAIEPDAHFRRIFESAAAIWCWRD